MSTKLKSSPIEQFSLVFVIMSVGFIGLLAMGLIPAPQQQSMLGICIYEVAYLGPPDNQLVVAWTQPPCSHSISILDPQQHNRMYHSSAPTGCGKVVIYNDPRVDAPAADTFPQLCQQQHSTRRALGEEPQ